MSSENSLLPRVWELERSLACSVRVNESLRQQLADSQKQVTLLRGLLLRYRTETPPAHSPHMICHLVDEALAATEPKP